MKSRVWLGLITLYIALGTTYLAIHFAVQTIPPFFMTGTRFLVAGLILYVWRRLAGDPAPTRLQWRSAIIIGFFLLVGGIGGVSLAETSVPSGITALLVAAKNAGLDTDRVRSDHPLLNVIPFSSERKMMTTLHQKDGGVVAITKGAPGIVLSHCTYCRNDGEFYPLSDPRCQEVRQTIQSLQREGMYVLGLATKRLQTGEINDQVEQGMSFMGLLVLTDPPRMGAAEAIAITHQAGIRVVMITGDNGLTAQAVAGELGIGQNVVDARDLAGMTNSELFARVRDAGLRVEAGRRGRRRRG